MSLFNFHINAVEGTIIFILALLAIASFALGSLDLKKYLGEKVDVKEITQKLGRSILIKTVAFIVFASAAVVTTGLTAGNGNGGGIALSIIGSLLFFVSLSLFLLAFVLHFYKFKPADFYSKKSFIVVVVTLITTIITLFMMLDGLVYLDVITFPLMNKIYFNRETGQGIAFYALFILAGALLSYFISDHEMYKKYKRHGLLENVFYIAFPAGIVGARIWYVIGDWHRFAADPIKMFYIWEGGLAIMGGALLGIIAGVLYVKFKRKEISLLFAVDMIVPTIILAQAIGRWGNFFNQEVYGASLTNMNAFFFLPEFIKANMFIGGSFRVPLFFIESMSNILGFFVIRYGVGEALKRYKQPLDMAFSYAIWYGLTRVILEPLRDPSFNMGTGGEWSYIWGYVFAAVGVLAIVVNHVVRFYINKKKSITVD